ncbi:MAG: hypothetical protein IT165_01280 [Bryobacterales bacterium]|nr:hypothetical protein [Bryobacterales bacterium]
MIGDFVKVAGVLLVTMGGWFGLQAMTRKVCRGGSEDDVFQGLSEGCGGCSTLGLCKRRGDAHRHTHPHECEPRG